MKRPTKDHRESKNQNQLNLKELKVKSLFLIVLIAIFVSDSFASRLDDAEAAYNSGDFVKAAKLDEAECKENRNMAACTNLARAHYIGEGVKQDYQKAITLYEIVCGMGPGDLSMAACANLARAYYTGQGVEQDKGRAKALSNYACNGGYQESCSVVRRLNEAGVKDGDKLTVEGILGLIYD